ncbi:protein TBATA-like isoform X2 [Babylonia areolata]
MTTSEVFRPSDGDLLLRDNVANGLTSGPDLFRQRPATHSGYRFGQLSHNSFFTRHNPHPHRVRHLKGLLDVPICSVNDDGYFASPRYSLQFPPNSFNNSKLNQWKGRIPVNAINVNSQLHPINTITGLDYFSGLNSYPWRERAVPKVGMVPVTEAWRDELKRFTDQLGDVNLGKDPARDCLPKEEEPRPRTSMYSQETGRLIPPPSRAMSRGNSRRGQRMGTLGGGLHHIAAAPDMENMVLTMLCQILQTEDVNAVQAWLCSAGETEKTMVMDMIKAAMAGREEYWKQYPAMVMEQPGDRGNILPPINGAPRPSTGETNRLVLEKSAPPAATTGPKTPLKTLLEDKEFAIDAPTNDVFKPMSALRKPPSQHGSRPPTTSQLAPHPPATTTVAPVTEEEEGEGGNKRRASSPEPRLKYTKTPAADFIDSLKNDSVNTF